MRHQIKPSRKAVVFSCLRQGWLEVEAFTGIILDVAGQLLDAHDSAMSYIFFESGEERSGGGRAVSSEKGSGQRGSEPTHKRLLQVAQPATV